jgi:tetratricopeptide (TPR) repeat protein
LDNPANQVPASEIRPLVDRIAESPGFRRSSRLKRFLRYVTEQAVNSPGQPLKEIQVAMAVFDKDASFEPRLDPIVRVEASRLRLRLLEFYVQSESAESIVIEIPQGGYVPSFRVLRPTGRAQTNPDMLNSAAHRLYLKGRFFWAKRSGADLTKAADYFRRALAVDPSYARGYLGLADCSVVLGYFGFASPVDVCRRAKAAAIGALNIDPSCSEAHATITSLAAMHEWDKDRAAAGFQRAIDLQPEYAFAHQLHGVSLLAWNRFEEGLAALRIAEQLDPLAPMVETQLAAGLYVTGRHAEAEEACQTALELEPSFWPAHYFLGLTLEQECRYEEAIRELKRAVQLSAGNPLTLGSLGHAYARGGRPGDALRVLSNLQGRQANGTYVPPFAMGLIRVGLCDKHAAFEMLEIAAKERSPLLGLWLTTEPRLAHLRSHSRYSTLIATTGSLRDRTPRRSKSIPTR